MLDLTQTRLYWKLASSLAQSVVHNLKILGMKFLHNATSFHGLFTYAITFLLFCLHERRVIICIYISKGINIIQNYSFSSKRAWQYCVVQFGAECSMYSTALSFSGPSALWTTLAQKVRPTIIELHKCILGRRKKIANLVVVYVIPKF